MWVPGIKFASVSREMSGLFRGDSRTDFLLRLGFVGGLTTALLMMQAAEENMIFQ